MQTAYKKNVAILFCLLSFFSVIKSYAQDSCYNCSLDSLKIALSQAGDTDKKIELLTLIIDNETGFLGYASAAANNIKNNLLALLELSATQEVKDIQAYKTLLEAIEFLQKKDYLNEQTAFKKSIALFDLSHKKIPNLISCARFAYNAQGNQEDRFKFYSEKLKYYLVNGPTENTAACYYGIAGYYLFIADYNYGISNYLKATDIYRGFDNRMYVNGLIITGSAYIQWGNLKKASAYLSMAAPLVQAANIRTTSTIFFGQRSLLADAYNKYTESIRYADSCLSANDNIIPNYIAMPYVWKAFAYLNMNETNKAFDNLNYANNIADSFHLKIFSTTGPLEIDFGFYEYYSALKNYNEAEKYLLLAYAKALKVKSNLLQLKYLKELSVFYGNHNKPALAFDYTQEFYSLTDSLETAKASFKIAQYESEVKEMKQKDSLNVLKQQSAVQAAVIKKNNLLLWVSLIAIILISISLFFVYRQFHFNKKTLQSLRQTQKQLIQSEKMASLGDLTAGIAHEIQNPLNFVNNFSEVNKEMIEELLSEKSKEKNNRDEELEANILNDLALNEEKINHHGKRADAIVKGMLQHSRKSSGVKEPTDINALCDEYLRLSYHGLRAKDKSFNADFKTDFDKSLSADAAGVGKINIVPQNIGRVLLNLFNNAFYAVNERLKVEGESYKPEISVQTKRLNGKIEIVVSDNGSGISSNIIDKIFQPFFTTKPTGQGTGLGLSLAYDIITKEHSGTIKVESKKGKGSPSEASAKAGTKFIIELPV